MSSQSLLEKLQLMEEKNLLIQGLPSSIEKQFIKLSFSKNVTPLLKIRKIDFALVFAVSQKQLMGILKDVIPVLHTDAKLWIAYPKQSSKIASDLTRDKSWDFVSDHGFETEFMITLDNVWTAARFKRFETNTKKYKNFSRTNPAPGEEYKNLTLQVPPELQQLFITNEPASSFFNSLAFSYRREYVEWIAGAKKEETKKRRLETTMKKLTAHKKYFKEG